VHADNNVALANALILMHFRLSHLNFQWFSNRTHSLSHTQLYTYTHPHTRPVPVTVHLIMWMLL